MACVDSNSVSLLKKKFQALKASIKAWCKEDNQRSSAARLSIQSRLTELDKLFDKGKGNEDLVTERTSLLKNLQDINSRYSLDLAQKAKIRWSIEGDENSKYFHGIINKKRSQLAICGVLVDGDWIDEPHKVKNEFFSHFSNRFYSHFGPKISLDPQMFKRLSDDQKDNLESNVTYEEIKKAVWDCGTNKSPGPDGFTFDFIRRYWKIMDQDMVNVVRELFVSGKFPPGCNSSFITLIPKKQDAKVVKDFCPITRIGCIYKIIAKIMANRLSLVISDLISDVQFAFVANRQILDGPFILNELLSWCKFHKTKAMIFKVEFEKAFDSVRWNYLDDILNNFGFGTKWRGWIQGVSLFCHGVYSFHSNILNDGLLKGIRIDDSLSLSHLFYADDAVFIINIHKSKLMGIGIPQEEVTMVANLIGCTTLSMPFNYLGVKVGISSSRSKRFFNGVDKDERKISIIGWNKILASKKKGGLGVSSFFALNRALLLKWIWRRPPRGGIEEEQPLNLVDNVAPVILSNSNDRWVWSLDSSSEFLVKTARSFIDEFFLPTVGAPTRWVKVVPIKINIFAWKVSLDKLPSRFNLSLRGIDIPSIICPICSSAGESCSHLLFSCNLARLILRKVARWWELDIPDFHSYEDWLAWLISLRISKGLNKVLEGVFYVMWWVIWKFRNQVLFSSSQPRLGLIFNEIVLLSFTWCSSRCKNKFDWIS
ncbi:RNA-directed DNA polymerase, eukaryota [Tanacetum coccineum]